MSESYSYSGCQRSYGAMYVPVVGPFIQMGSASPTEQLILAVDGVAQTAGLVMLVAGLFTTRTVLVRNDLGVSISPAYVKNGAGMALSGSF